LLLLYKLYYLCVMVEFYPNETGTELIEKPLEVVLEEKIKYLSQWLDDCRHNLPIKEKELYEARKALERIKRSTSPENINKRSGINWKERVLSCVTSQERLIKTVDILKCVFGSDIPRERKRSHTVMISLTLTKLIDEGKIKEYKVKGTKGYYYGLPQWFNGDEPDALHEVCVTCY